MLLQAFQTQAGELNVSARNRQLHGCYPVGSLMATRMVSQVYPQKLGSPHRWLAIHFTGFACFNGFYDLLTCFQILRHIEFRKFYRTYMLCPV